MAAFVGGIVGQEVIKSVSRMFTPIHQWFYFEAAEVLPVHIDESDMQPLDSRLDYHCSSTDSCVTATMDKLQ